MKIRTLAVATVAAFGISGAAVAQSSDPSTTSGSSQGSPSYGSNSGSSSMQGAGMQQHDRDMVRQVQQQLSSQGFDAGPADGIMGEQTKSALRQFQQSKGMQATGELDGQTASALGVQAGSAGGSSMGSSTSSPSGSMSGSSSGTSGSSMGGSTSGSSSSDTGTSHSSGSSGSSGTSGSSGMGGSSTQQR
jgi:peptidoglycan hydrolase-like protein with peptidoglycan-binding domain